MRISDRSSDVCSSDLWSVSYCKDRKETRERYHMLRNTPAPNRACIWRSTKSASHIINHRSFSLHFATVLDDMRPKRYMAGSSPVAPFCRGAAKTGSVERSDRKSTRLNSSH